MKVTIQPSQLKGNIQAPASKSSMQRACAAALLKKGRTNIYNAGRSNDDKAALRIIEALGAKVEHKEYCTTIDSTGSISPREVNGKTEIDCGESGLSIRMFTPIVGLSDREVVIKGEGSLSERPMDFFDTVLPALGVQIKSNNGKLPLIVKGPLKPVSIEIDGSLSSQFLTGLLMAYSASPNLSKGGASENSKISPASIKVRNLKSKPYIDLTLDVMRKFGLSVPENRNYEEFIFHVDMTPDSGLQTHDYYVEGDWSGGAFLLVAGAIVGSATIRSLDLTSTQADKAIVDVLMSANAAIAIEAKGIKIRSGEMNGFDFDATDCPDLFPPLVALAVYCNGESKIKGVRRLTHKESNRALTLQEEFGKMGANIELNDDVMIIQGGNKLKGAVVHSRHDHRIAMALAVAALKAEGETIIEEAQAVRKSYPDFYHDLRSLGASLSLPFQLIK
jgi:3-phosphoshikimate 1-carboxyvinyltransferase